MLRWKPIILNLEDIEFFWGTHDQNTITNAFVENLLKWRNCNEKGQYWYYFGNYTNQDKLIINDEYLRIFNHQNIADVV